MYNDRYKNCNDKQKHNPLVKNLTIVYNSKYGDFGFA